MIFEDLWKSNLYAVMIRKARLCVENYIKCDKSPSYRHLQLKKVRNVTEKPLYSTDRLRPLNNGPCKMRLESNGRSGKKVTVLFNLPFNTEQAKEILKTLQSQMGTGGTYKDGVIEFRGDLRGRVEKFFAKNNIKIIRAGG